MSSSGARASPACTARRSTGCARPAVVPYTGVSASGSGVPAALTVGCIMVRPRKPPLTSPRTRTRLPGANCFCCEG